MGESRPQETFHLWQKGLEWQWEESFCVNCLLLQELRPPSKHIDMKRRWCLKLISDSRTMTKISYIHNIHGLRVSIFPKTVVFPNLMGKTSNQKAFRAPEEKRKKWISERLDSCLSISSSRYGFWWLLIMRIDDALAREMATLLLLCFKRFGRFSAFSALIKSTRWHLIPKNAC